MSVALSKCRIGDPLRFKSLSVFPLFSESNGGIDYLLSDEAFEAKSLVVEEVSESGSVPDLLVENKGDTRVLFLEGEELIGAKQNRILNTSILVAAHSKTKVPVSCVEQGRWSYKSRFFGSSGSHSPSKMRYFLKSSVSQSLKTRRGHRSDQGKVWQECAELQAAHKVVSPTSAMSDVYDTYQEQFDEFKEKLQYVDGASGIAVAVGDKILAVDLFDKPSTCQKVWSRALSSFLFDVIESEPEQGQADSGTVERLLGATDSADWEQVDPIGEGEEYRAEFDEDHASALVFDGALVHGSVVAG